MSRIKNLEIIVIGERNDSIALSEELFCLGAKKIALVDIGPRSPVQALHLALKSFSENYSRTVQAHGNQLAKAMTSWSQEAFAHLSSRVQAEKLMDVMRYGCTQPETTELKEAVDLLKNDGFEVEMLNGDKKEWLIQKEKDSAFEFSLRKLRPRSGVDEYRASQANLVLELTQDVVKLQLGKSEIIEADMLVILDESTTTQFFPEYRDVFIPFQDQWNQYSASSNKPDFAFIGMFSNEVGYSVKERVFVRGASFLRPLAGIGSDNLETSEKCIEYFQRVLQERYGFKDVDYVESWPFIGYRSCDLMPTIGPLASDSRVIVAGGLADQRESLLPYCLSGIAELVMNGKSAKILREFWPERHRSIGE